MTHLVDSLGVRDGISVLDDGDGLSSEDGLVDTEGGGVDLHQSKISRDLVTNCRQNETT